VTASGVLNDRTVAEVMTRAPVHQMPPETSVDATI
jgi:hypothetical protein